MAKRKYNFELGDNLRITQGVHRGRVGYVVWVGYRKVFLKMDDGDILPVAKSAVSRKLNPKPLPLSKKGGDDEGK